MITRIERATATRALSLPRRLMMRRYRSPRKVLVLPAPAAASPRTALRYRLPLPVLPAVDLAPDWMVRGHSFAQETRCPAVGNRLMSSPTSAMMTCAMCGPTPGISSRMSTRSAVEGTADLWAGEGCAMSPGQFGVVLSELAGQRLDQVGVLELHPAAGQAGQEPRAALPGDQCLHHVPDRAQVDPAGHRGDFDQGVFQELFQPLPMPGPFRGQVHPQSGVVPQHADLLGRHERGPQQTFLG